MSDISKLSGHLRAIRDMAIRLHDEALANGDHPEMPGGEALASLADVADRDVWERRVALREDAGDYDTQDELDDAQWPPLQTLWFWTDDLREQTGITVDDPAWRPTIASEAAFLANPDVLQWLWSNEPRWDDLVADVEDVRKRLEGTLHMGIRPDRLRVVCPDCAHRLADEPDPIDGSEKRKPKRLMWIPAKKFVAEWGCTDCAETVPETRACEKCGHNYGPGSQRRCKRKPDGQECHGRIVSTAPAIQHLLVRPGSHLPEAVYVSRNDEDRWKCGDCRREYTEADVVDARAAQLRSAGAARWVSTTDTISVMQEQGWDEEKVRSWLSSPAVEVRIEKGKRQAWWPDVWRVHHDALAAQAKAARLRAQRAERRRQCESQHGPECWDHHGQRRPGQHGCAGMLVSA